MNLVRVSTAALVLTLAVTAIAAAQATKPADKPAVKAAPAAQASNPAAKLPAPILAAFTKAYPNATIKDVSKETEDGKTVWEVESIDNKMARDLVYNPDGSVVEIEEELAPAAVPPAVAAAIKAAYPKATITKAEQKTVGKTVTYEFGLKDAAVKSAEFTADGKLVPAKKEK